MKMINPKKQGWYERQYPQDGYLDYWDGFEWYSGERPSKGGVLATNQDLPWKDVGVKTERFTGDIITKIEWIEN